MLSETLKQINNLVKLGKLSFNISKNIVCSDTHLNTKYLNCYNFVKSEFILKLQVSTFEIYCSLCSKIFLHYVEGG